MQGPGWIFSTTTKQHQPYLLVPVSSSRPILFVQPSHGFRTHKLPRSVICESWNHLLVVYMQFGLCSCRTDFAWRIIDLKATFLPLTLTQRSEPDTFSLNWLSLFTVQDPLPLQTPLKANGVVYEGADSQVSAVCLVLSLWSSPSH